MPMLIISLLYKCRPIPVYSHTVSRLITVCEYTGIGRHLYNRLIISIGLHVTSGADSIWQGYVPPLLQMAGHRGAPCV